MAARKVSAAQGKKSSARKFTCQVREYKASNRVNHVFEVHEPTATIPGNQRGYSAGAKKLQQLFRLDPDGDSILAEAAKFVIEKGELTKEEFKETLNRLNEQADTIFQTSEGVAEESDEVPEEVESEMVAV